MPPDVIAILFLFVWQIFMLILVYAQQQDIQRLSEALYRRQTYYAEPNPTPPGQPGNQKQPAVQSGYYPTHGPKG